MVPLSEQAWLQVPLADQVHIEAGCFDAPDEPVPASDVTLPVAAVHFAEIDLLQEQIIGVRCADAA